jgi:hypothetical protein
MTRVVHCKKSSYDVYVGRHSDPEIGKWGNPYTTKESKIAKFKVDTVEEACFMYKKYILNSPLYEELPVLKNKTLACWCTHCEEYIEGMPLKCHAQVLQILLDYPERFPKRKKQISLF